MFCNGEVILKKKLRKRWISTSCFSPRNGEVILKWRIQKFSDQKVWFQSPQWGSNSKVLAEDDLTNSNFESFSPRNGEVILKAGDPTESPDDVRFSPRNGEVILKERSVYRNGGFWRFQSPQWGSNSKVFREPWQTPSFRFSPRNGEVILKICMNW